MKRLVTAIIVFVVGLLLITLWWQNGLQTVNPIDKTPKIFIIKSGDGVREIANNLKREGLIRDPIVFFLLIKSKGLDREIQAGDFRLNPSMNANEIVETLRHGILDIWVTVPEGFRAEEIADLLKIKIPSYDESWREELSKNEGFLFPDTYLIPKDADVAMVITLFRDNFESKYATIYTSNSNLTKTEIVKIASMIEREAKNQEERPLVASVIGNRYALGMKLDIDATIQYVLGYQVDEKRWWKKSLTFDDLKINSLYNTYRNAGLPPTPISNPGIESLMAAANPASSDYLFYMTDINGITHFAKTLAEHTANIQKYKTE